MNKTVNINLAGMAFHIDEDAYSLLYNYLIKVKANFAHTEGKEEIIADIEARMAELFQQCLGNREVISKSDVEKITTTMGAPEEYALEEDAQGAQANYTSPSENGYKKRIFRNSDDKILGGVASGLGAYFDVDPVWIRLGFAALFFGFGTGFWLYVILWMVIPEAKTTAEKLQMRGEKVNISNIEKTVKETFDSVRDNLNNPQGKTSSAFRNFFEALFSLARFILIGLGKLIVGSITAAGIFVLVALSISLLWPTVHLNSGDYYLYDILPLAVKFFPSPAAYKVFLTGLCMFTLLPLLWAILAGLRILFRFPALHISIRWVLGMGTFVGLLMLISASVYTGTRYERTATYVKEIPLAVDKSKPIMINANFGAGDSIRWESNFIEELDLVDFDIRKGYDSVPQLVIRQRGMGYDRRAAQENARSYTYQVTSNGNALELQGELFNLESLDQYRGQEVDLVLMLPIGYQVIMDHSMIRLINDIKNVQNVWDPKMVNQTWEMTNQGLNCLDCPANIIDRTSDWLDEEESWPEEEETKIRIEGVEIHATKTSSLVAPILINNFTRLRI